MAEKESYNMEQILFDSMDKIKYLLSPEMWANELLNCSKNELFILIELYRFSERNMSQIAEYLNVPLNTATGIVARMEKRDLIARVRSKEDKRVVSLTMTDTGKDQIQSVLKEFFHYGTLVFENFTAEEVQMAFRLFDRVMEVLKKEHDRQQTAEQETPKIRKITIT